MMPLASSTASSCDTLDVGAGKPDLNLPPGSDLWVFAYGSLIWDPGFPFVERHPALLRGYHRRFCILSHRYRGTVEKPGLVLGLDRGGSCWGMAYRVAAADVPATLDRLWEREMVTRVYRPRLLPVRMSGQAVRACTFIADPAHPQYSGRLCQTATAEMIALGVGERGRNLDYLANTVAHLEGLGIKDHALVKLLDDVRCRLGEGEAVASGV